MAQAAPTTTLTSARSELEHARATLRALEQERVDLDHRIDEAYRAVLLASARVLKVRVHGED